MSEIDAIRSSQEPSLIDEEAAKTMPENNNTHRLTYEDKEVLLIGTAHVSRESADLVKAVIEEEKPDTVCVELCDSRMQAIKEKDRWRDMNIIKVIKEKKAFLLLSNLILASFQKKVGQKFNIKPGEEMIRAMESAEIVGAEVYPADREIRITLTRAWRLMGLWTKLKVSFQALLSLGSVDDITEEEIERMKEQDVLESILAEIGKELPEVRSIIIDERDKFLAQKIRTAPGKRIVAVVGAGHVPGIKRYWNQDIDMEVLQQLPPPGKVGKTLKWLIPSAIIALIVYGFFAAGSKAGVEMVKWWVLANGVLASLGAIIALAHPFTIAAAFLAAPITSLNPMIAAGWVSGLVETVSRKPTVRDFESLGEDITSVKGFWKNKITRILLVVVFTNIGSSVGTFVALPLMVKAFA